MEAREKIFELMINHSKVSHIDTDIVMFKFNPDDFEKLISELSLLQEQGEERVTDKSISKQREITTFLNIAYNEGYNNTKSREFDNWCKYATSVIIDLFDKHPILPDDEEIELEIRRRITVEPMLAYNKTFAVSMAKWMREQIKPVK